MMRRGGERPGAGRHGPGEPGAPPQGGPFAGMIAGGAKAKNVKGTLKDLIRYLSSYRWSFLIVFVLSIASTVFMIIGPKILGNATTKLFEGIVAKVSLVPGASIDFSYIGRIALLLLVLYIISAVTRYLVGLIMVDVSMKVTYDLRKNISEKIDRLPLKYFDTRSYGEVLSHIINDVDTISTTLNQSLSNTITSVVMLIGIIVMMFTISWFMTLITLLMLPLSFAFVGILVKASQKHYRKQQDYLGHVNGHVEEMYGGHIVMKAFNGERRSIQKFDGLNNELYDAYWKSQFFSGMMFPLLMFVGNLGYVAVAIVGGYLAIQGRIQVGDIQAFIQYVRSFTQPITQTASVASIFQSTVAASERVFEFLDQKEEIPEAAQPVVLDKVQGAVSFKNIFFGYNQDKIIINDFSADIKSGQRIAIVGPTGAGKTTMVKLLMRFYDVNKGAITVDGVDIREMRRNDLRSVFGMVLQDTWLFNDNIKENIRYGNLDATDEQVIAAAKAAYADHFIRTLPGSYDMVINEDASNISQGQKQLLTIARAFLVDPKILILDEATSSVDTRTEVLIQQAMDKLMQGRTSFIIAHRLSTIRNADNILVMLDGAIVEQGNHEALLAANGVFADMYNSQFESAAVG